MAIKKTTDLGNTGILGDHWTLSHLELRTGPRAGTLEVHARYALWKDAQAKADGLNPLRRTQKIIVVIDNADPKISEIEAAVDKELTRVSVAGQAPVAEVKAQAAVKAKAATAADPGKGIDAEPEVKARGAIKAVNAKGAVRSVKGGELEGGDIV